MSIYGMSDKAILREIGRRLRRTRLEKNLSQQRLGELSGLNRTTISEAERGEPFGVQTLVRILRALDALDGLDVFLPDPGLSPLQIAEMKGKQRQRASRQVGRRDRGGPDW